MKSFTQFMAKIPANYLPRIEQSITHAVQVISDPNSTSESYDAIAKELAELQKNVGIGAAKAWQGEVAERLKAEWIKAGRDGIELEQQVAPKITQVLKTAEKLRKTVQSSLWAAAGKVALGLGAVTLVGVAVFGGIEKHRKTHDERLRGTLGILAQRSCMDPGSVTQEDLDSLPRPYREDFLLGERPYGLGGDCYVSLYQYLGKGGADAEKARRMSTPVEIAGAQLIPEMPTPVEIAGAQLIPEMPIPRLVPPPPFSTGLPRLKEFAITACREPSQISLHFGRFISKPYDFSYRAYDDNLAKELASGLDDCSRQLFDYLIANIRASEWRALSPESIRDMVTVYWRAPDTSSGDGKVEGGGSEEPKKPPVVHDPEGTALEQLREIERRKRWGLPPR